MTGAAAPYMGCLPVRRPGYSNSTGAVWLQGAAERSPIQATSRLYPDGIPCLSADGIGFVELAPHVEHALEDGEGGEPGHHVDRRRQQREVAEPRPLGEH